MTPEEARFHEILLIAGLNDRIEAAISHMLEEENPLGSLALELSSARNTAQYISALHHYAMDADMEKVGCLVRMNLKQRMNDGEMDLKCCAQAMHRLALASERTLEEPWQTMNLIYLTYEEAEAGILDMEGWQNWLKQFIDEGIPSPPRGSCRQAPQYLPTANGRRKSGGRHFYTI